jgi:hypothetical protein
MIITRHNYGAVKAPLNYRLVIIIVQLQPFHRIKVKQTNTKNIYKNLDGLKPLGIANTRLSSLYVYWANPKRKI